MLHKLSSICSRLTNTKQKHHFFETQHKIDQGSVYPLPCFNTFGPHGRHPKVSAVAPQLQSPLEATSSAKKPEKETVGRTLGTVLEPTWVQYGAENNQRTYTDRFGVVVLLILEGFGISFEGFQMNFQIFWMCSVSFLFIASNTCRPPHCSKPDGALHQTHIDLPIVPRSPKHTHTHEVHSVYWNPSTLWSNLYFYNPPILLGSGV